MNLINFNSTNDYFTNYIVNYFSSLDRRIIAVVSFALGIISCLCYQALQKSSRLQKKQPSHISVKGTQISSISKSSRVGKNVSLAKSKNTKSTEHLSSLSKRGNLSNHEHENSKEQDAIVKDPSSNQPESLKVSEHVESQLNQIRKVNICVKNILITEGVVKSEFINSFINQLNPDIGKPADFEFNVIEYDTLKKISSLENKVFFLFTNCKSRLQPDSILDRLNKEVKDIKALPSTNQNLIFLFVTVDSLRRNVDGLEKLNGKGAEVITLQRSIALRTFESPPINYNRAINVKSKIKDSFE